MYLQVMPNERMGQDGKALLRSLQNESISLVDLLVRESFQNSLDATLNDVDETLIDVDVKEFDPFKVSQELPGIEGELMQRYGGEEQKAIIIGDRNTTGLEGSIRDDDETDLKKSNLYKLVYGIAMNQDQAGAGGSWGLGKTSYFRVGAGIVVYYTRVKLADGNFGERLVASLIENPENDNRLLKNSKRGIAWWGTKDSKNENDTVEPTYPITDALEIKRILNLFDLEPYDDSETGTRIIIPFINESLLLPYKDDPDAPVWQKDLTTALNFAIQRWYSPRIENDNYQQRFGSFLRVKLNGKRVNSGTFNVVFKILTNLYTAALTGQVNGGMEVKDINVQRVTQKGPIGRVAFRVYSADELKALGMEYKSPEIYFSKNVADAEQELTYTNRKFLAFARKPGMIVKYDLDGEWTKDIVVGEGQFLIGFFVPISESLLQDEFSNAQNDKKFVTVEDYLRGTENADHADWDDISINGKNMGVVQRIRKGVVNQISKVVMVDEGEKGSVSSSLGQKFGKMLLPSRAKGNVARPKSDKPKAKTGGKNKRVMMKLLSTTPVSQTEWQMIHELDLEVYVATNVTASIQVLIQAGDKKYSASEWFDNTELTAPFDLANPRIESKAIGKIDVNTIADYLDQGQFLIKNVSNEDVTFKMKVELLSEREQYLAPDVEIFEQKGQEGEN